MIFMFTRHRMVEDYDRREYQERIDIGVLMLDSLYAGWLDDVNLHTLWMHDSALCVFGQIALARGSTYDLELCKLVDRGLASNIIDAQIRYGFGPGILDWTESTEMWAATITRLRQALSPALILAA